MTNGMQWSDWTPADVARHNARVKRGQIGGGLPADTPEDTLLSEIRRLAKPYGWLTYHTHDSRKSEEGFPDLVLTNGVSLLMMELKDNTKKPSKEQAFWLSMLNHTGKVEAGIWRPNMWSEIVQRLTRGTR